MRTAEEYFKYTHEKGKKEAEKRELKWRNEILEEIKDWDFEKLKEKYVQSRLSRISYSSPITPGMSWEWFHEECRFCGLEYIQGEHTDCCDDCWNKNKGKTLEDLEE